MSYCHYNYHKILWFIASCIRIQPDGLHSTYLTTSYPWTSEFMLNYSSSSFLYYTLTISILQMYFGFESFRPWLRLEVPLMRYWWVANKRRLREDRLEGERRTNSTQNCEYPWHPTFVTVETQNWNQVTSQSWFFYHSL